MLTRECQVHFRKGPKTRKQVHMGEAPPKPVVPGGTIPRLARLMALAIRMDGLLRNGTARHAADLARLGGVTRARLTQIMNLLLLAPDIQEDILFLPRTTRGRAAVTEPQVRQVVNVPDWSKQRRLWREMLIGRRSAGADMVDDAAAN